MSEEKWNAKVDQAGGKIKEGLGKVTGDKSLESEGKVEKVSGKFDEFVANAKDTLEGLSKGLKKDKDEERK
ncbi:CsbD family protein [Streptococcus halichoeri]|uniref:CsbD family protein n=1 Tax=Streptococcus halichoeri TaxID=254785 RepID=UPI00135B73A1|nr:CsbD family protein [Streptococcus halichoeri]